MARPPTLKGRDMSNRTMVCAYLYSPTLKLVGLASPNDTLSEFVTSWSKSFEPYTTDRSQLPVRGERPAQARRQRQVHVVRLEHRDVAVGKDRRHVRERIRIAEEVGALAVAVRVTAEGVDLERVPERERRVVHEGDVVHRAVAGLVRLRAGERKVGRRLLLEERDLVGSGTQRLVAVAILRRQVQEAAADAEPGVDGREQRVAVVDAPPGRLEIRAVLAPARRRLAALVGVLQHDVDDARNGVRTVLRAGAVAQAPRSA